MNKSILGILLLSILLVACSPKTAQLGDTVTVEYVATLPDGTPFDKSTDYDVPITFVIGKHKVLMGMENMVVGMKAGEQKKELLRPDEAYGIYDQTKVQLVPLNNFPSGSHLQKGMALHFTDNVQHKDVPGIITEISNDGVTVDLNHPAAGKSLWFNITVVKIESKK